MAEQAKSEFAKAILAAAERFEYRPIEISCPELDGIGKLYGRGMDGRERQAYLERVTNKLTGKSAANANEVFCAFVLCDESGDRLFGDNGEDVKAISKWPASLIQRIWRTVSPHCGLSLTDLEDEVKN